MHAFLLYFCNRMKNATSFLKFFTLSDSLKMTKETENIIYIYNSIFSCLDKNQSLKDEKEGNPFFALFSSNLARFPQFFALFSSNLARFTQFFARFTQFLARFTQFSVRFTQFLVGFVQFHARFAQFLVRFAKNIVRFEYLDDYLNPKTIFLFFLNLINRLFHKYYTLNDTLILKQFINN